MLECHGLKIHFLTILAYIEHVIRIVLFIIRCSISNIGSESRMHATWKDRSSLVAKHVILK